MAKKSRMTGGPEVPGTVDMSAWVRVRVRVRVHERLG